MTTQQVREYLNEILPQTKKYNKSIKADSKLSNKEIDKLCQFVSDFDSLEEQFDWRSEISNITSIACRLQTKETVKADNKAGSIPKTPDAMPFLIRQVLFYLGVACSFYELAPQAEILKVLKENGLNLSHNFYSRMRVTDYVNMQKYKQPKMLFPYLGQKHNELGVAVKNLVYQAGDYNLFIDVFGGSCAASLAFPRRNNSVYIYNDLDDGLCNLFDIISDDEDYTTLIEYIRCLQEDLRGERTEWNPFDFDFQAEAQKFYINRNGRDTDKELRIVSDLDAEVSNEADIDLIIGFMSKLYDIVSKNEAYSNFMKEVFGEWRISENPYPLVMSYFTNYSKIISFIKDNYIPLDVDSITYVDGESGKENLGMFEHQARANQLRYYEWYAICDNVLNDKSGYKIDKVFLGAATIFMMQFVTRGDAGLSSILRIYKDSAELLNDKNGEAKEWIKFLNTDYEYIISELHSKLKKNDKLLAKRRSASDSLRKLETRTIIENLDCFKLLNKYKGKKKVLIYSDSPYIATKQYKAGDFSSEDMKHLLELLLETKSKFIFSCRACKSNDKGKATAEVLEGNQVILDTVFGNFSKIFKTKKLYVLSIATGKGFWEIVKNNGVAEIMITNYEIYDFIDNWYKTTSYKVYKYDDFLDMLKININI
ncbi:MAG: hypothetical protein ACOCNB_08865 [Acetivibrio ethanolgignens]